MKNENAGVPIALGLLYVIWGSTFLAIRIALEGYPPLLLAGVRYLIAGSALYAWTLARGERITAIPSLRATLALLYLIVLGSIVAYTAYQFLLARVRPTLAASYAYVNPVVAVCLGAALAGETVAPRAVGALALILGG